MENTITIQLTQGQSTIIDAVDADLAELKWYASKQRHQYYARHTIYVPHSQPDYLLLHRVVLERKLGRSLEKGEYCDHINGNKLDNRRENLRLATTAQNITNVGKRTNNKSGFKGVSWDKGKSLWHAQIQVNRINIHLGFHKTPEEAHAAYCEAARKFHGEFARFE